MQNNCNGYVHVVAPGDTLYTISREHNVRLVDVLKANPYVNVYNLQIGDEICVPIDTNGEEKNYYITKSGDTLNSIAKKTGTTPISILDYNKELGNIRIPLGTIIRISKL